MLMVTLATIAGTIWLYIVVPKGFFPTEDTGYVIGITEGKTDIAFPAMAEHQRKVADIVRADPAVAYVNSTVGAGGPNTVGNSGRMLVALKPRKERDALPVILARLRTKANVVPGMQIFFQPIQNINLGGKLAKSQYQYTLQSNDTEALYRIAPELRDKIAKLPELLDVTTDLYIKNPQVTVEVDREKSAVYGVSIDQVRQELYNAFGSRQVATIYTPANDYQVILETKPEFQQSPNDLNRIYIKTTNGTTVPLSAVTHFVRTVGPLLVNHQGQQPAVTISFNLTPGVSLGQAVDAIQNLERDERLPATITTGFQGTAQVFQDSLRGQGILILAAIFAAYVVLGILYESFIHPITIISGLPSAGIGAILTLDAVQDGIDGDRHDRHRHAGRHRQEECDHDDRLRDRAPPRRPLGGGGDPRSRDPALPPDHDDDVRRDLRHTADRARHRRRRRTAPAARRGGGRRPLPVAAAHALHHAGDLSLSRPLRPHAQAPARTAAGRSGGSAAGGGGGVDPVVPDARTSARSGTRSMRILKLFLDSGFAPSACAGMTATYSAKLVPQPQDAVAFGFFTLNEAPIRSSTKSISEPAI